MGASTGMTLSEWFLEHIKRPRVIGDWVTPYYYGKTVQDLQRDRPNYLDYPVPEPPFACRPTAAAQGPSSQESASHTQSTDGLSRRVDTAPPSPSATSLREKRPARAGPPRDPGKKHKPSPADQTKDKADVNTRTDEPSLPLQHTAVEKRAQPEQLPNPRRPCPVETRNKDAVIPVQHTAAKEPKVAVLGAPELERLVQPREPVSGVSTKRKAIENGPQNTAKKLKMDGRDQPKAAATANRCISSVSQGKAPAWRNGSGPNKRPPILASLGSTREKPLPPRNNNMQSPSRIPVASLLMHTHAEKRAKNDAAVGLLIMGNDRKETRKLGPKPSAIFHSP